MQPYRDFIAGRDPLEITDYRVGDAKFKRVLIEMLIMKQALLLGGYKGEVIYYPVNEHFKLLMKHFKSGKVAMSSESLPYQSLKPYLKDLRISEPMIRRGEYVVGLYTSADNSRALASTISDVQNLSAVSNRNWTSDWQSLEAMNLKDLQHSDSWRYIYKSVARQRADFTPFPFRGGDMSFDSGSGKLLPIPGLKLVIRDSFHNVVSKCYPHSEQLITALNSGIKQLRDQGRIQQAYTQANFFVDKVKDWQVVNSE